MVPSLHSSWVEPTSARSGEKILPKRRVWFVSDVVLHKVLPETDPVDVIVVDEPRTRGRNAYTLRRWLKMARPHWRLVLMDRSMQMQMERAWNLCALVSPEPFGYRSQVDYLRAMYYMRHSPRGPILKARPGMIEAIQREARAMTVHV